MRLGALLLSLIFVPSAACNPLPIQQGGAVATPMLAVDTANAPTPTATDTPLPIHETYRITVKTRCGPSANGVSGYTVHGVALCFEEPGFFEARGGVDYFILMVTHKYSSPRLDVHRYDLLQGVLPTATARPTPTPGPTFTPLPLAARTLAPAWPVPPTPVTVRTIMLNVTGYCDKPTSSTSLNEVTVCFAVPPGKDNQGTVEYWTVTVTRDLTPTVKYGTLEWATPTR